MELKKRDVLLVFLIVFSLLPVVNAQTCTDKIKNGGEEGTDCGGSCPFPCPPGTPSIPPTCKNGVQDANEDGKDCGGVCPFPCPPGTPSVPPTCRNGVKDNDEDGKDCGGVCPFPCPPGTPTGITTPESGGGGGGGGGGRRRILPLCPPPSCIFNWTCGDWSVCIGGKQVRACRNTGTCSDTCETITLKIPKKEQVCSEGASCFDGTKNQDESDVDCGGVCVFQRQKCKDGRLCAAKNENCFSDFCDATGRCNTAPTCFDKLQNQGEAGLDCGGPCPSCSSCSDGVQNGAESGVDCGGSCPNQDCCTNRYRDPDETDTDCGGSCAVMGKLCDVFQACKTNEDCKNGRCQDGTCTRAALIEQPRSLSSWSLLLAFIMPFWWIILLAVLLIVLAVAGYHYYESKPKEEELPLPPLPVQAVSVEGELVLPPPIPEVPIEKLIGEEPAVPPSLPVILPSFIEVKETPILPHHYREVILPLYIEKEHYKKILEYMPLLTSTLLKNNTEISQDLVDLHYHKGADYRSLRDAAETIYKQLVFLDAFLFVRGKKQYKIKFEE